MNMIAPLLSNQSRDLRGDEAFGYGELFFTRTDGRGVIQAFNDVFLRVAELTAAEALGAPHKIVRHDDMPKAVFHVMWQRLKAGEPVAAYVKNRTKSDGHYWVFAVAVPNGGGGFVSVRLKPSSAHFAKMRTLYAELRRAEKENGLSAEESADRMAAMLKEHGYADYGLFEARALSDELISRAEKSKRPIYPRLTMIKTLFEAAGVVREERQSVLGVLDTLRLLPTNMRLISHRIEHGHGPLSTLSERYGAMADTLLMQLSNLITADSGAATAESEGLFACGIEMLLCEAAKSFAQNRVRIDGVETSKEQKILKAIADAAAERSQDHMVVSARSVARLARDLEMLQRSILALDSIRVMSRVEFGQMIQRSRDLANVIQRVDESHKDIRAHLARLSAAVLQIEEVGGLLTRHAH